MKTIIFILLAYIYTSAQPEWYPPEKYHPHWHMGLSTASQLIAYNALYKILDYEQERALLYSIPIGLMPGLVKEIFDYHMNQKFNMEDMGYNTMGVTAGISMVLIYRLHF